MKKSKTIGLNLKGMTCTMFAAVDMACAAMPLAAAVAVRPVLPEIPAISGLKQLQAELTLRKINWQLSEMPLIYCDHNLLYLVWINLISNSVKFTPNRKIARIEAGAEKGAEFYFTLFGFDADDAITPQTK